MKKLSCSLQELNVIPQTKVKSSEITRPFGYPLSILAGSLFSFFLLFFSTISSFSQSPQKINEISATGNYYEMDFVFTGKVKNEADSVFALRYTISRGYYQRLRRFTMEDSRTRRTVDVTKPANSDSLEVQQTGDKVYLLIRKYNKYDLPVLMQAEDKKGKKYDLFLHRKSGRLQSGPEFKEQLRATRQRYRL